MTARLLTVVLYLAIAGMGHAAGQEALRSYAVDPGRSSIYLITHKAGLLSFLGHQHAIVPGEWTAELCLAQPIPRSAHGTVAIQARSLVVDSDSARALAGLGGGPGEDDIIEIQGKMLDVEHLDAQAYAEIVLEIDSVTSESESSLVAFGRFTLHGITREVRVPIRVEWADDGTINLGGVLRVRQRDYGIEPESVAGLVKVSNDVDLHFLLVASPTDRRCTSSDRTARSRTPVGSASG